MIIGEGDHKYEVIDQWGTLPKGINFGTTHGIIEDASGRIFVHNTGEKCTIIFDPDGNVLDAWGADYAPGAHGMFHNRENGSEFLYLAATTQEIVVKVTLTGEEVYRITSPPRPDIYNDEKRFIPTEVAVASDGVVYIADGYGQHWVHRYSPEGRYMDSFGGPGADLGELNNPHGISVDTRSGDELILVSDRQNVRLQYFTLEGEPVRCVTKNLRFPCTAEIWGDEMYIPDLRSRVTILDKDDNLIAHLGDRPGCWKQEGWPNLPPSEWAVGGFSSPHDLHVDKAGNIYVVEWMKNGTGKVTKLIRAP